MAFAIVATSLAAPAEAFELFGVRFFGEEPEPPPPDAVTYTLTIDAGGDDAVTKALRRASLLADEASDPSPGSAALIASARRDYKRLLATLYDQGRYGGAISILIDGREAADLPLDTDFGDTAEVVVNVEPGPVFLFDDIRIENEPGPVPEGENVPKTPEALGLLKGMPAEANIILSSEASMVSRWRHLGYPKASIAERTAVAQHRTDTLDVGIAVAPGRPAVFGPTTVSGTRDMDPAFVAYYAGITPGEPFDPDDLDRARDQLRRLEVFSASRIIEADAITADGQLPIEISVAERKRRVFGVGAKYSTVEGFGVEGYWRHRNLFGRAEKLQLEAKVDGIEADDPTDYNYRVAATFIKPGVFTPYTDFTGTIYAEQEHPDTYRSRAVGTRMGFTHRVGKRLTLSAFGLVEASTIDRTTVGDGEFLWFGLPTTLDYDASDDELNPTKGYRVIASAEPFYEAKNGNVGLVSGLEGRVYQGVADGRLVLAARAAVGSIVGVPLDEVPANRLYFAGGGGSIRGYPYREVGPTNAAGRVIGGRSIFTASLEARTRVTQNIGVVPFVDVGNAFESELPDFSERLRVGVGVGLRYYTSFAPIRVDVAVPLDRLPGDPSFAFYIGIGQAF